MNSPAPPEGWLTVNGALGWLAFGSTDTDWDRKVYFGASLWFVASPADIAEWLGEATLTGSMPLYQTECSREDLEGMLREAAYRLRVNETGLAGKAPPMSIREAAGIVLADLTPELQAAAEKQKHEAIWRASEQLRIAIASGNVGAAGWRGSGPGETAGPMNPPRVPIPPGELKAPVTLANGGVLAFSRGEDITFGYVVLWSGLLIDSADLRRLRAANTKVESTEVAAPSADDFHRYV